MEKESFKFRAECLVDVVSFLNIFLEVDYREKEPFDFESCTMKNEGWGKVQVEMVLTGSNLNQIRSVMSRVVDGHVMEETVNYAREYTGESCYERSIEGGK